MVNCSDFVTSQRRKRRAKVMDTPVKSLVSASSTSRPNPASQFEDSPIFKYINNLSPIKPLNSVKSFNLLSFASPKTSVTSSATSCHQNSKMICSPLSYSVKPEPADGENEVRETQVSDNGIQPIKLVAGKADYPVSSFGLRNNASHELSKSAGDAYQSTGEDPYISLTETDCKQEFQDLVLVKRESVAVEPAELSTEPPKFSSRDHGDVTNSVSQTVGSEISPVFFIQGNTDNGESSVNNNLALQGLELDHMKGHEGRWESMLVDAADQLLCDSPFEEGDFEETDDIYVDSDTLSFMENVLQPSEENIHDILNLESPLGSFEKHDENLPYAYPNGADKHSETGQALICAPVADDAVSNSHAEVYNTPYLEPQQMLPRRTIYRKLVSEGGEAFCTAVTSEKRLVSSKCEVHNCSSRLPGIGLHLNALARCEKITVKHEISTYKRQLITIPCASSTLHFTSSDPKPLDSELNIDPMQTDLESSNNIEMLNENACHSLAATKSEGMKQNSTKRKRCKSENAEGEACKRCNCKRSKCLKLYCECFAAGLYCVDTCSCQGCLNKPVFEETVLETRRLIELRNPLAFAPKVIRFSNASQYTDELNRTPASPRHKRGCNCKKSGCLKKYCECFQGGVGCSLSCRCEGCRNSFGRKHGADDILLGVTESTKNNSAEDQDPQVTPSSQISRNPSGFVGLHMQFPSFSNRLLQPRAKMTIEDENGDENDTIDSTSVKSVSPNSKRVLANVGPRLSSPTKFCRKLILRSIPSFPKFPDHKEDPST